MNDEHSAVTALQVVAGIGGTKDDLDKLLLIMRTYRELNPHNGIQPD